MPTLRSVRCTEPPRPREQPVLAPVELGHQAQQAAALRQVMRVAAVVRIDDVILAQRFANARGNAFLSDTEVGRVRISFSR